MKTMDSITLKDVQAVYGGPEGDLWELVMGEQIHIGGFVSSMDLAEKAGIAAGTRGVDLCCCNGAGMRFLARFKDVAFMHGVDATKTVIKRGRERCEAAGFGNRIVFTLAQATATGIEARTADFVWGEDAWCYVEDKSALIAEAARIVKTGGVIAFTDWIEGSNKLSDAEAQRFLTFMKFPNIQDLGGYQNLLKAHGCEMLVAQDTGRFAPCVDLYLNMLQKQLTYDALRIIGFDTELMSAMAGEMIFMQELAHAGKIVQGLFVAKKL
jgi:ubiquinone/menaquinone biosynthesis C-methylase UbiE